MKRTLIILVLALSACSHSYEVFSDKYRVSFSCNISQSPFNKIQSIGYFLSVYPQVNKGSYVVKEPDGRKQEYPCTEVQNRTFMFGLAGFIMGAPYFGDGEVYAYDLGCPLCDRASARLSVSTEGVASCSKCGGSYDLNNNGICINNESRPLYRYRTTLNGSFLMIRN